MRCLRAGDEGQGGTAAEAGVPLSARMVGTDFRRCEAVSEGWHEHRAGKPVGRGRSRTHKRSGGR
mgnify:CR=1 FL=1